MSHFHPAVSTAAARLQAGSDMTDKPDLEGFTLMKFLDKFAFKNAKVAQPSRGASIMQPYRTSDDRAGHAWVGASELRTAAPVNTSRFWAKNVTDIAAEDVFFHRYFAQVPKTLADETPRRGDNDDSDADDDAEDQIWKALVSGQDDGDASAAEDDGLDDSDMDLDDLDAQMNSGSEEDGSDTEGLDAVADDFDMDSTDDDGDLFGDDAPLAAPFSAKSEDMAEPLDPRKAMREKRKKLRNLPTFASAEDYEALMAGDDEI